MESLTSLLCAFLLGVATHIFYFNRYECHRHIYTILCLFFAAIVVCQWIWTRAVCSNFLLAGIATTQITICYFTGTVGSTLCYRLFFNPLNRFPGPYSARLTDFWIALQSRKDHNQFRILHALHAKYGPYVRTGANSLSIIDPNLVEPAYHGSEKAGVTKGSWYDFDWPTGSLWSERTFQGHHRRRRLWSPAFSDKALRQYEKKVTQFNDKFLARIAQLESRRTSINVSELFSLYSFDIMGSLVFGVDYKMLETNKKHHALELLTEGLAGLGLSVPMWLVILLRPIPFDFGGTGGFHAFCDAQVERAVKMRKFSTVAIQKLGIEPIRKLSTMLFPRELAGLTKPDTFRSVRPDRTRALQRKQFDNFCDAQVEQAVYRRRSVAQQKADPSTEDQRSILYWVLKAFGDQEHLEKDKFLRTDARLLIVAGSDTTAAALTYLFYHLAQRPSDVEKIRGETQDCMWEEWTDKDIRHCQHLNGAINEALRLHPPGPSGVHRMIPLQGLCVGEGVFIPGGTEFNMPLYSLNRNEDIYADANSFMPERWYSRPELVKHKKAFVPFLAGPYSCIGKNIALTELRTLTTRLLMEYDVSLGPGEDGSRLLHESRDHFTISLAPLDLVFTPIKARESSFAQQDGGTSAIFARGGRPDLNVRQGPRQGSLRRLDVLPEEALRDWTWGTAQTEQHLEDSHCSPLSCESEIHIDIGRIR